jgi:hypothetical protein
MMIDNQEVTIHHRQEDGKMMIDNQEVTIHHRHRREDGKKKVNKRKVTHQTDGKMKKNNVGE